MPPAGFEAQGQKIRTLSQVFQGRVGTCLDTALLFAAVLEQAGLNPVLILTRGYALCGVWLQPQEFAQLLTNDTVANANRYWKPRASCRHVALSYSDLTDRLYR